MPGLSGLSNQSWERSVLPRGAGVLLRLAMIVSSALEAVLPTNRSVCFRCEDRMNCPPGQGSGRTAMLHILAAGGLVSLLNFGIHALMTVLVVVATRRTAKRTDHLHAF